MNQRKNMNAIRERLFSRNYVNKILLGLLSVLCFSINVVPAFANESNVPVINNVVTDKRISGTVVDEYGEPIIGANIVVKGMSVGIITDLDGKFELSVPDNATVLQISYMGYVGQEITLGNQQVFNIILKEDIQELNEVVAVGYGSMRKKDLTSAITNVSSKDFVQGATNSVADLIAGKVAGLSISTNAVNPAVSSTIQIRGVGSMNASNEPLVIIDGVPGASLNSVSPQDIESFSVLKDGASAAIYGTRGANGVILITTKTAARQSRVIVDYDGYVSTQSIASKPEMLSKEEFMQHGRDYDYGYDTDWYDVVTRQSFEQNHNLSMSYGTDKSQFRAAITYRKVDPITKYTDREEYGGRINFRNKFMNDYLEASGSLAVRNIDSNDLPSAIYGVYQMAAALNPTMPVYNEDGTTYMPVLSTLDNPVGILKNNSNYNETKINNYDITLKWNILNNLNTSVMFAQQSVERDSYIYNNSQSIICYDSGINGSATRTFTKNKSRTFEWNTNYDLQLNSHSLKLLGGYSYQDFTYTSFSATNQNFSSEAYKYNNLADGSYLSEGKASMSSSKTYSKLIAFYGRASYDYNNLLLGTVTIRNEGSSKFGENNKWGDFISLSAGWRISQMPFMESLVASDKINDLKLRFGYGETGRDINSPYQSLATYGGTTKYFVNGEWVNTIGPTINPNPDLKWEKAIHYNGGIDFTAMEQRLSGNIDVFIRDSKDLLYNYTAIKPPMIHNNIMYNVGTIRSKGFEWNLNWRTSAAEKLGVSIDFLGSYTKTNMVTLSNDLYTASYTDLNNLPAPGSPGYAIRVEEGKEVGMFYGWKYAGVDTDGNIMVYNKDGVAIPGDQRSEEDKDYIGRGVPAWQLSLNTTFTYKNWDLSLQFRSALDFQILNMQQMYWGLQAHSEPNVLKDAYGRNAHITGEKIYCDYFIEDGDYLKLDVLTLGYNFRMPGNKWISSARIYGTVQNVFTLTGYRGLDPSAVNTNGLTPGIDGFNGYPTARTFTMGVKLSF